MIVEIFVIMNEFEEKLYLMVIRLGEYVDLFEHEMAKEERNDHVLIVNLATAATLALEDAIDLADQTRVGERCRAFVEDIYPLAVKHLPARPANLPSAEIIPFSHPKDPAT